jgi:GntR family transcriptional regulator
MLPFRVALTSGDSPFRQIVFAATRAVVSGELPAGATFPSVRELSQAIKINPNTAHKVVAELVRTGLLEVLPGVGTVVSANWRTTAEERDQLLSQELERLVVEAARLGLNEAELLGAVQARWAELFATSDSRSIPTAGAAGAAARPRTPVSGD